MRKYVKNIFSLLTLLLVFIFSSGCDEEESLVTHEDLSTVVTNVTLFFTNVDDPNDVVRVKAQDPDDTGVQELITQGSINLDRNKTYTLTFEIFDNIDTPGDDIVRWIEIETYEFQIFFGFTAGAFVNLTGDGNIDRSDDPVDYNDFDENSNPVGLSTNWTTGSSAFSGTFSTRLLQLREGKMLYNYVDYGEEYFDLTFPLNIQ